MTNDKIGSNVSDMGKHEERKEWLASLKPGDEVAVIKDDREEWVEIHTLTAANEFGFRWARTNHTSQMPKSANPNGRSNSRYGRVVIVPVTEKHRRAVWRHKAEATVSAFRDWSRLNDADLDVVLGLVKAHASQE